MHSNVEWLPGRPGQHKRVACPDNVKRERINSGASIRGTYVRSSRALAAIGFILPWLPSGCDGA